MKLISMNKRRSVGTEWVGGRVRTSLPVLDGAGFYPDLLVWIEMPDGVIVGSEAVAPHDPEIDLGMLLLRCLESPAEGPPRRPASIRVESATLAREVRESIGDSIPIRVQPTPEVDEAQRSFDAFLEDDEEPTYLGGGEVSEPVMREFFHITAAMSQVRPWETLGDHLLRLDIPALGVEGVCVSLMDGREESGILLFPSLDACLSFGEGLPEEGPRPGVEIDFGTSWLGFTFADPDEVPESMLDEAKAHDWELAESVGFPLLQHVGRDGLSLPLTEKDVRLATAAAMSASAFVIHKGDAFASQPGELPEPTMMSFTDREGNEVHLSGPYEEFDLTGPHGDDFEPVEWDSSATVDGENRPGREGRGFGSPIAAAKRSRSGFQPRASRNAPCPCGSGKKYKKCCLDADWAAAETVHERDRRLVDEMHLFADSVLGVDWFDVTEEFDDADATLELAAAWSVYVANVDGRPIVDWYLESGAVQDPKDALWLEAQRKSWLSVWKILEVEPGQSLRVRDALTEVEHQVTEYSASETLRPGMYVVGRMVEFEGDVVICGLYPRALLPLAAEEVVEAMRKRLRRKTAVPPERLRVFKDARYLLERWEEAVFADDERRSQGPKLRNARGLAPADAREAVLSFKRKHYAEWADIPVPALGNVTPREAARSKDGRRRLAALLEEMEFLESRGDPETAYDFGELRRELGLER